MTRYFTIPEFAKILKISKSTAYRILKEESLSLLCLGPRTTRISEYQIEQLAKKYGGDNSSSYSESLAQPAESNKYNEKF